MYLILLSLAGAQFAWSQAPAPRQSDERVVISVGDEKITASELDHIIQALPPQYRGYYSGPGKHLLPQYIIQMKILSAEARKQKLDEKPEVQRMLETARESILADAARRKIEEDMPVSDQAVEQLYEKRKPEFEEVHIRQILIRTQASILTETTSPTRPPLSEADARKKLEDVRQRILAGADFQQMARENSDDTATAASGGDLGYVSRRTVVPPVADAAFSLAPGQVSEVIPTPYGMDLIKVEGKRTRSLEEVKSALTTQLRQSQFQEAFKRLESQYKVVVDEKYFSSGPTRPTPPAR
ncbi:MAG TPA: peptidylprolyl isomerase [Terriglobia bacterium]|nr:peptidylprolyl isomerase [Terriglobia bacterium]